MAKISRSATLEATHTLPMDPHPGRDGMSNSAVHAASQGSDETTDSPNPLPGRSTAKTKRTHSHPLQFSVDAHDRRFKGERVVAEGTSDSARAGDLSAQSSDPGGLQQRKISFSSSVKNGNIRITASDPLAKDGREGSKKMDNQTLVENGDTAMAPSPINSMPTRESRASGEIESKRMSFTSLLSLGSLYGGGPGPGSQASSVAGSFKASAMDQYGGQKEHRSPVLISPHMEAPITPITATDNVAAMSSTHSQNSGLS